MMIDESEKEYFHVNMLKKWETSTDFTMFNDEVDPNDEIVLWRDSILPQLSSTMTTPHSSIIQRRIKQ